MNTFTTHNPKNNTPLASYPLMSDPQVETIIRTTYQQFFEWQKISLEKRSTLFLKLASVLRSKKDGLARLITDEMGKVIVESEAEVEKCAVVCEYYAKNGAGFLQDDIIPTSAKESYVTFQPLGIIMGIMPWNFPLWQVFRFIVPTLYAGNACLVKHAPNTMGCAQAIEPLLLEAGFPEGLFKNLVIDIEQLEPLYEDARIAAFTITGSTKAGRAVAEKAGRQLKKVVLELGGSDPYLILEDADLELAVKSCLLGRMRNSGQSCIAAKRFIVVEKVYDDFKNQLLHHIKALTYGDPLTSVSMGPMARPDLRDTLHHQVIKSVDSGANCLIGGHLPEGEGNFYPPTLLCEVTPDMPCFTEELFGPVSTLIKAKDEAEAILLANQTPYGLGAGVFSQNLEKAKEIATSRLFAGSCFVNGTVASDPRLPFGGTKESGHGRELGSYGIKEFVNIKSIVIN